MAKTLTVSKPTLHLYTELNPKTNAQLFPSGHANLVSSNGDVDPLNTSVGAATRAWMRTLISWG